MTEAYGSISPYECFGCERCGSNLTAGSLPQRDRSPHLYFTDRVETDGGPMPLTRCRYCRATKASIEKRLREGQHENGTGPEDRHHAGAVNP